MTQADDEPPASWAEALREGEVDVAFRYRYENVADDAVGEKEARASTLRTTLGYAMKPYRGFSFFLEAENVSAIFDDDLYNNAGAGSLGNGVRDRPVVADPELTELNQAFARYARGATTVTLGRQEILHGDHRFVGNVGWRQNHQSFDALRVLSDLGTVGVDYAFIENANRIFGDDKAMASHLLRLPIELGKIAKLTAFGYLLDYDRPRDAALSTATFGAELAGERELSEPLRLLWELELAEQRDHGDNPARVDVGYRNLMLGFGVDSWTIQATWEVLEGEPGRGSFQTPLATLHKWNGWADKFLVTPPDGLETLYLTLSGKAGKAKKLAWTAVYLDFQAESSARDFGRELDLELSYLTPWGPTVALAAFLYHAEDFAADVDKLVFWTSYRF